MKLLVATEFGPNALGGGPAVVRQMLQGFREQGNTLYWWACHCDFAHGESLTIDGLRTALIPSRLMPARILPRLKALILERVWSLWAAQSLRSAIATWSPDCLWVIPHNWSILPIHSVLVGAGNNGSSVLTNIRWHTTVQDYPDMQSNSRRWGVHRAARMARKQQEIYAAAISQDATSAPMLEDLWQTTGVKGHQVLHQGLEQKDFDLLRDDSPLNTDLFKAKPYPHSSSPKIRIAYAGTILVEKEFMLFADVLTCLRTQGYDLSLEIWSAHTYKDRSWFCSDWMIEHGHKSQDSLLADLRACQWGFIPMSLSDEDPRYNRFSFPTKFITYLAAGLPVISMGHPKSSVMMMTSRYNVGVQLPTDDIIKIVEQLGAAFNDNSFRHRSALLQCAREHFDATQMRDMLWSCLRGKTMQLHTIETQSI